MLTSTQKETLLTIGRAMIPAGEKIQAFDESSLARLQIRLEALPETERKGFLMVADSLNTAGWAVFGKPLSRVSVAKLQDWFARIFEGNPALRAMLRLIAAPIKLAHFDHAEAGKPFGAEFRCSFVKDEPYPWLQSIFTPDTWDEEEIECDVVVVGTGAGGAVVAKELAEKGLAVLMMEKGPHYRREQLSQAPTTVLSALYLNAGANATIGLPVVSLPVGSSVGGSTTVNSGTCLRPPDRIFESWRREFGLPMSAEEMAPHYDKVATVMKVQPAERKWVGPIGDIIERGCNELGYSHHGPLMRNAPDCDGQGTCCFGCPTDAKRSTNVSFIPLALRAGATLLAGFEVGAIQQDAGVMKGLMAEGRSKDGKTVKVKVNAKAVVISGGALFTPLLLEKNKLGLASGQLGRNLSIHPAASCIAMMEEEVRGYIGIPQGYGVDQFQDDGIMLEGGFMPLELMSVAISPLGQRYTRLMDQYNNMALFAGMIEDSSRGRVVADPNGIPRVFYQPNQQDLYKLTKLIQHLVDIFHAAGAREVIPMLGRWPVLRTQREIAQFRRYQPGRLDFEINAFHPLGSARMGADPRMSVVGQDHKVHGTENLFVVDGSVVPSSLGVNPQMTIMALATRAAGLIAQALETPSFNAGVNTAAGAA